MFFVIVEWIWLWYTSVKISKGWGRGWTYALFLTVGSSNEQLQQLICRKIKPWTSNMTPSYAQEFALLLLDHLVLMLIRTIIPTIWHCINIMITKREKLWIYFHAALPTVKLTWWDQSTDWATSKVLSLETTLQLATDRWAINTGWSKICDTNVQPYSSEICSTFRYILGRNNAIVNHSRIQ